MGPLRCVLPLGITGPFTRAWGASEAETGSQESFISQGTLLALSQRKHHQAPYQRLGSV